MHVQGSQSQLVVPPPSEPWPSPASYLHLYGKAYRLPLTAYDCDTSRISQPATTAPPTAPAARPRLRPARPPAPPDLLPLYPGRGVPATVAMASRTPAPAAPAPPCHACMLSFRSQAIHSKCASRKDNRRRARRRAEGERRHSRQLQGGEPRLQCEVRWVQPGRTRGTC